MHKNNLIIAYMLELNIKLNNPPADVAVANMLIEVERLAQFGEPLLKIVHGYGSNNIGGTIKKQALQKLAALKRQNKIAGFFPCEQLNTTTEEYKTLIKKYPELILDPDLLNKNPGITLILLK